MFRRKSVIASRCIPAWQSRGASAFLDAVTGATREWLLIDIPAPGPCSPPLPCPFSASGLSVRYQTVTLPFIAFCGIVRLIISTTGRICQPLFAHLVRTAQADSRKCRARTVFAPSIRVFPCRFPLYFCIFLWYHAVVEGIFCQIPS